MIAQVQSLDPVLWCLAILFFFFSIRLFFTDTDDSHDSRERDRTIFYSSLPLPPAHKHWDIYLQLCMWDDYHVFLIATLVFTRLLLDEIYHLIELPFEWLIDDAMFVCLLDELILGFCYSDLTLEAGGFELASSNTLVLQANQLTKCASQPEVNSLLESVALMYLRITWCSIFFSIIMLCAKYKWYSLLIKIKRNNYNKTWDYTNTIIITTRGSLGLNTK